MKTLVDKLKPSLTLALTQKVKELKAKGVPVVNFAAGEPDFDTPEPVKNEMIESIRRGFTKYTPTSGIPELKEAILKKLKRDQGLDYQSSQIVVSCGAKHSIYNLIQTLCDPGDEIIFASPFWVSYPEMGVLTGAKSVMVETSPKEQFRLRPDKVKRVINSKTRVLILNSPANPTGSVISKEDLIELSKLVVTHRLWCISDEIYEYYTYDGIPHISCAALSQEMKERTFVVNGVSKAYSMTGLRIGYIAGNADEIKKISSLQDHSTSCPPSISQRGALAALNLEKSYTLSLQSEFQQRRDLLWDLLSPIKGLRPVKPQGAFYLFCGVSDLGIDSEKFVSRLLDEAQVATIPGESFGAKGFVRISFATSQAEIREGCRRIQQWIGSHFK